MIDILLHLRCVMVTVPELTLLVMLMGFLYKWTLSLDTYRSSICAMDFVVQKIRCESTRFYCLRQYRHILRIVMFS